MIIRNSIDRHAGPAHRHAHRTMFAPVPTTVAAGSGCTHSGSWAIKASLSSYPTGTSLLHLVNVSPNTNYSGSNTQVTAILDDYSRGPVDAGYIHDLFWGASGEANILANPGLENAPVCWTRKPSNSDFNVLQNP